MTRLREIAQTVFFIALLAVTGEAGWWGWQLAGDTHRLAGEVDQSVADSRQLVQAATNAANDAHATLDQINRPCNAVDHKGHPLPLGVICDLHETLKITKLAIGQVNIAARHENARLTLLDAQETTLAADAHTDLTKLAGAIDALQPSEAKLSTELEDLDRATNSLADLAADPNLKQMAANANSATANLNTTLQHTAATTGDVQQAVHAYLHPTWPQKIWHAVANTGVQAAKFFW